MATSTYLWIAAGSWHQADLYSRQLFPHSSQWRYVQDIQRLQGHRDIRVHIVGTFWDRQDAPEIWHYLTMIGARVQDTTVTPEPLDERVLHDVKKELHSDLLELGGPHGV